MKSKFFGVVAAVLMVCTGSVAAEDTSNLTSLDRFELWNECGPVGLLVEDLPDYAAEIGLTVERIETTVRSRLRAAKIYDESLDVPYLYVNVNVLNPAYGLGVEFNKLVTDYLTDKLGSAVTWKIGSIGTHSQDAGYILQWVAELTDIFVDEYLRVNAEAC